MAKQILRWSALGFLAYASIGSVAAQTGEQPSNDYLEQVRRENEVARQKLEADVRSAQREASRLLRSDPARATACLETALAEVEADTALPLKRRQALGRMLREQLRLAQAAPSPAQHERAQGAADPSDRATAVAPGMARAADSSTTDPATASRVDPSDPAAQGAARVRAQAERQVTERKLRREQAKSASTWSQDMERSSMPPAGDVDYPKDWSGRSERRRRQTTTPLTNKETALLRTLAAPVSVAFKDVRFEDVINELSAKSGQPIIMDRSALKDADVGYDTPVTIQVKGVSLRTVLRKILGEYGLAYVVKDEAIQITTALKAREMLVTRAYPISDLVIGRGALGGVNGLLLGPATQQAQAAENVKHIIELITTTVEPDSWRANGGYGTIVFHAQTMSLIVKQSAEVHAILASSMTR